MKIMVAQSDLPREITLSDLPREITLSDLPREIALNDAPIFKKMAKSIHTYHTHMPFTYIFCL